MHYERINCLKMQTPRNGIVSNLEVWSFYKRNLASRKTLVFTYQSNISHYSLSLIRALRPYFQRRILQQFHDFFFLCSKRVTFYRIYLLSILRFKRSFDGWVELCKFIFINNLFKKKIQNEIIVHGCLSGATLKFRCDTSRLKLIQTSFEQRFYLIQIETGLGHFNTTIYYWIT